MNNFITRVITASALLSLFFGLFFFCPPWVLSIVFLTFLIIALFIEWPQLGYSYWAPIYPALPFTLLIYYNQIPEYRMVFLFIFSFAWIFDTASYITGKLIGRHKLAPTISPKKTWEGLIGGVIAALIFNIYIFNYANVVTTPLKIIIFTCAISITALFGDLFISILKRRQRLKDTGSILPGHGGILDRFDSVLFLAVFIYFVIKICI